MIHTIPTSSFTLSQQDWTNRAFMIARTLRAHWRQEDGQDMVEYALLLGFVALAAVSLLSGIRTSISSIWTLASTTLTTGAFYFLTYVCASAALETRAASFVALPIADLHSLGQYARSQFEQWLSGARTCARIPVPIVAGVGVGILLVLACLTLLLMRARRQNRKFREQLDNLLALRKAIESTDRANAEFIACMIPQIRTPMNAIVGFIDLALKADLDPKLREHLDTVRTSADWLMHLENDALEFSSIETEGLPLDNVPFSISECILSAMKIVEREAPPRSSLQVTRSIRSCRKSFGAIRQDFVTSFSIFWIIWLKRPRPGASFFQPPWSRIPRITFSFAWR